jgi:PAS domain S-box-containing protein
MDLADRPDTRPLGPDAHREDRVALVAALLAVLIGVLDVATGEDTLISGLEVVPPLIAATTGRIRSVLIVSAIALPLSVFSFIWNDTWGESIWFTSIIATTAGCAFALLFARLRTAAVERTRLAGALTRAEGGLRRTEESLEAILAAVSENVTVQGADGRLVWVNQAAAEFLGYGSPEEVLRTSITEMMDRYDTFHDDGTEVDLDRLPGRRALAGEPSPEPVVLRRIDRQTGEERWLLTKSRAILDEHGQPMMAVNVIEDITAQRRREERQRLLAEASKLLGSSLDWEETVRRVTDLAVPALADWFAVDLHENGRVELVAVAHPDPEKLERAQRLRTLYPPDPNDPTLEPVKAGQPIFLPEIPDEMIREAARDEEHLALLREFNFGWAIGAPIEASGQFMGVLTLVSDKGRPLPTPEERELVVELGRRFGVALANARLYSDRVQLAETLQAALRPDALPEVPGTAVAARLHAVGQALDVGGDFYDVFPSGDAWVVAIGDVSGKGAEAATITGVARFTMRTAAHYETSPGRLLFALNRALVRRGRREDFCTAICARLEQRPEGLTARIAVGGHPPPFLVRADGRVERPPSQHGPLLGIDHVAEWPEEEVVLEPGDALVMVTDGVLELRTANGMLGEAGVEELLARHAGLGPEELADVIEREVESRREGPARDDVAIVAVAAVPVGAAERTA